MTRAGLAAAISTPASAGPATPAPARAAPSRALALPSSAAGATSGVSPPRAGVKNASPAPRTAANPAKTQIGGWLASMSAASRAWAAQRAASAVSITGRRPNRSAITPPPSMNSTWGTMPAASTKPSSVAVPPLSSTAKITATDAIEVPSSEVR